MSQTAKNALVPTTVHSGTAPARTIRIGLPSDLPYVLHLQNHWSNNVGFLCRSALRDYLEMKQLLLVLENGDPAGYLNWTCTAKGLVRIPQVAVDPQLLRTTIGSKLMRHVERAAIRGNCSLLRLRSRSDLPANRFWPILGFTLTATFLNKTTRMLPNFEWTRSLVDSQQIAQGLITAGKSFRPLLRNRPPADLRSQLIIEHDLPSNSPSAGDRPAACPPP